MGQPGPAPPTYFVWVDALRGLAALSVVVFHYHHFYLRDAAGRPDIPETGTFPYAAILDAAYRHGGLAVEHFWVISGFVFAHVYLGRPTTMRAFWVARFARLYPLHLVTLLAVAALQAVSMSATGAWQIYGSNDLRHFLLQVPMASNWSSLSRGLSFNGPIWSVSFELVAYAAFFLSLPLLRGGGLGRRSSPRRWARSPPRSPGRPGSTRPSCEPTSSSACPSSTSAPAPT